mmetsp:Transcript_7137/g.13412  ORF Transcript_7137/g.13412 Transcript_7137/m.13412 type:complete len:215 (+) Transcript_7137:429-1073(+)
MEVRASPSSRSCRRASATHTVSSITAWSPTVAVNASPTCGPTEAAASQEFRPEPSSKAQRASGRRKRSANGRADTGPTRTSASSRPPEDGRAARLRPSELLLDMRMTTADLLPTRCMPSAAWRSQSGSAAALAASANSLTGSMSMASASPRLSTTLRALCSARGREELEPPSDGHGSRKTQKSSPASNAASALEDKVGNGGPREMDWSKSGKRC